MGCRLGSPTVTIYVESPVPVRHTVSAIVSETQDGCYIPGRFLESQSSFRSFGRPVNLDSGVSEGWWQPTGRGEEER